MSTLKFTKLHPNARLPTRGSQDSAGLDLYCIEDVLIQPGQYIEVHIGLSVQIPINFYGRVAPRSGLALDYGINILAGVIDSDYRGEVVCILINHGHDPVSFTSGSRIAQLIIEAIDTPQPEWTQQLEATDRQSGGFGSTGN